MSITAKNTGNNFELTPAGNHIARCYSMIQLGSGRTGEAGCSVTLYFNEHGDLTEHSADNDLDGEASDLDD